MSYPPELMEIPEWIDYGVHVEPYYVSGIELPYHGWPTHPVETAVECVAIERRTRQRGIELNVGRLVVGGGHHDAGMHEDFAAHGFSSAEEYTAFISRRVLLSRGAPQLLQKDVSADITGTTHGTKRTDPHTIVLHWADVANIGKPYPIFARKSLLLIQEKRLKEPSLTFRDWQLAMPAFINFTIEEALRELPQIGEPVETAGSFDTVAAQNLDLFMKEPSETELAERLGMAT